jgi:branched-chain amino acid transport system permease protein
MVSVTSEPFNLGLSVEYIAMVIIGGLGSITGSIYGAIFIIFLNEILRMTTDIMMNMGIFTKAGLNVAPLREFFFGLAIVIFILFEPRGLAEIWRIVRSHFKLWPFPY